MFGHYRGLYFIGIKEVDSPSLFELGFYLLSSLQHEAVIVFFVLSGFLVGGPVWERMQHSTFVFSRYFVDRITRIYLVYLPSLPLVFLIVMLGTYLFPDVRYFSERPLLPSGVNDEWSWQQVPCHLLNIQGAACTAWGNNPPLWSLGYEWILYFVAPLLFVISGKLSAVLKFIPALAVFVILYAVMRIYIWPIYYVDCWFLGVLSSWVMHRYRVGWMIGGLGVLGLVISLPLSRLGYVPLMLTDYAVAISCMVVLASPAITSMRILPRISRWGADFSFSLYVLHLPLGLFIASCLHWSGVSDQRLDPSFQQYIAFGVTTAISLVCCFGFSQVTEKYTRNCRVWINEKFRDSL